MSNELFRTLSLVTVELEAALRLVREAQAELENPEDSSKATKGAIECVLRASVSLREVEHALDTQLNIGADAMLADEDDTPTLTGDAKLPEGILQKAAAPKPPPLPTTLYIVGDGEPSMLPPEGDIDLGAEPEQK